MKSVDEMTNQPQYLNLPDGRVFPIYEGEPLAWSLGLYQTPLEAQAGFPRMRAVIRAMYNSRPEQLDRERRSLVIGSFDRMFGHNAKAGLAVLEEEINRIVIAAL